MKKFDVVGIGNALVDILVHAEDSFLETNQIQKGIMTLVGSEEQAKILLKLVDLKQELRSGGSAANTMIALANSGGTGCYFGKVSKDTYGEFYKADMEASGIEFETIPVENGHTGTCVVLTTPDAERTMLTHLGISTTFDKSNIDASKIINSKIIYIEGYLWDSPTGREASIIAMDEAKKHNVRIAFTFSDPFCVNRYSKEFREICEKYVDIVFCNVLEANQMSGKDDKLQSLKYIGSFTDLVFMTDGENGCYYSSKNEQTHVEGFKAKAIDTVGAGDAFAAGVLFGLTHEYSIFNSARWGNYVASRIVTEVGARLKVKLMGRQDEILKN